MSSNADIYHEMIVDYSRNPVNYGKIEDHDVTFHDVGLIDAENEGTVVLRDYENNILGTYQIENKGNNSYQKVLTGNTENVRMVEINLPEGGAAVSGVSYTTKKKKFDNRYYPLNKKDKPLEVLVPTWIVVHTFMFGFDPNEQLQGVKLLMKSPLSTCRVQLRDCNHHRVIFESKPISLTDDSCYSIIDLCASYCVEKPSTFELCLKLDDIDNSLPVQVNEFLVRTIKKT